MNILMIIMNHLCGCLFIFYVDIYSLLQMQRQYFSMIP